MGADTPWALLTRLPHQPPEVDDVSPHDPVIILLALIMWVLVDAQRRFVNADDPRLRIALSQPGRTFTHATAGVEDHLTLPVTQSVCYFVASLLGMSVDRATVFGTLVLFNYRLQLIMHATLLTFYGS